MFGDYEYSLQELINKANNEIDELKLHDLQCTIKQINRLQGNWRDSKEVKEIKRNIISKNVLFGWSW